MLNCFFDIYDIMIFVKRVIVREKFKYKNGEGENIYLQGMELLLYELINVCNKCYF